MIERRIRFAELLSARRAAVLQTIAPADSVPATFGGSLTRRGAGTVARAATRRAWLDEIGTYSRSQGAMGFDGSGFASAPFTRRIATTTPRPLPFLHELLKDPTSRISRMRTKTMPPISEGNHRRVVPIYGGTRIGRQELDGELLEEAKAPLDSLPHRCATGAAGSGAGTGTHLIPIDPRHNERPDSDACAFGAVRARRQRPRLCAR